MTSSSLNVGFVLLVACMPPVLFRQDGLHLLDLSAEGFDLGVSFGAARRRVLFGDLQTYRARAS